MIPLHISLNQELININDMKTPLNIFTKYYKIQITIYNVNYKMYLAQKSTVKTHIYSIGYIFSKISRQIKLNPLQTLSVSMRSNNAGERPNLYM